MKKLSFTHFPGYARFLLDNKLNEFVAKQFEFSRQVEIPLLKLLAHMPEEQLIELSKLSSAEILLCAAENRLEENVAVSVKQWKENLVPFMSKEEVVADDITLVSLIRKRALLFFLPQYTNDVLSALAIIDEIDQYVQFSEAVSFETYMGIQQEQLNRSNTALQQRDELYKQAQALTHIGNWSWYIETGKVLWSDEMYRIYGLQPQSEDITVDRFMQLIHPEDRENRLRQLEKSLTTLQTEDYTMRIVRPDNSIVVLQGKSELVCKEGKPYKMLGTCQDITTQYFLRKQLEEEKMLAETIIETSVDIIAVYDKNLQLLVVNKKFEDLHGVKRQDILGKPLQESFPYLADTNIINDLNRALSGETVHYPDRKFIAFDKYYESYFIPLKNQLGEIFAALTITHDITEVKAAAKRLNQLSTQLRSSEDRYQKMVQEVEDYAILRLSPQGIVENWNRGAEKIKGYTAEEIIGQSVSVFYQPEELATNKPQVLLAEAARNGRAIDEGWRVRKNGSRFWAAVAITALHDEKGEVVGFTKVTRDLTERKIAEAELEVKSKQLAQAYEALERNNAELQRSNKELSSFGYVASHDLQEPLRKIMMFSQMIEERERDNLSDRGKDMFVKIHSGARSMKQLIEDLLAYSKLQVSDLTTEAVNLNQVVEEIRKSKTEIYQGMVKIDVGMLPTVKGIPFQLHQLFENIIGNAIKYSKPAEISFIEIKSETVSGKVVPHEGVELNILYNRITITDNGIGFEQQYADKIFQIFQRLHRKEDYVGTGIGLAICKKIVQNHRGFIEASGVPNVGATFTIYLPS